MIGTLNNGKARQVMGALNGTSLQIVPLSQFSAIPHAPETGDSPAEVASGKALAYARALGEYVLALDYWLYLDGVADSEQPRAHVRRIPGHPNGAEDETLLDYYQQLIARHGGTIAGQWTLGVAIAGRGGVSSMTRVGKLRHFVDTPSAIQLPGLPLSSLQVDPTTGRYVSEQSAEEYERDWQEVYGAGLVDFVFRALAIDGG